MTPGTAPLAAALGRLTGDVTDVAVAVALLFATLAGVRFMASNGSPARQAEARAALNSAGLGLAIVLSARLLVAIVVAALR